ncbi:MAG: hypothetical protein GY696_13760 [Gammaproteobacteria bacterium]|nr:hypothetical protein [Gammaproteobacteria bacterium]
MLCWEHCIILWVGQVLELHRQVVQQELSIVGQVRERCIWRVLKELGKQGELLGQVHCIGVLVPVREHYIVAQGRVQERCIVVQEQGRCR